MQTPDAEKGEEEISRKEIAKARSIRLFARTRCALSAWLLHRTLRGIAFFVPVPGRADRRSCRRRQSDDDAPGKSSWKQRRDWRCTKE